MLFNLSLPKITTTLLDDLDGFTTISVVIGSTLGALACKRSRLFQFLMTDDHSDNQIVETTNSLFNIGYGSLMGGSCGFVLARMPWIIPVVFGNDLYCHLTRSKENLKCLMNSPNDEVPVDLEEFSTEEEFPTQDVDVDVDVDEVPYNNRNRKLKCTGNVSALNVFVGEMSHTLKESEPELKNADRMRKIHEIWKDLSDDEKAEYQAKADEKNKSNKF